MEREQRERGGGNPKNIKNMRAEAAGAGTGGAPKHSDLSGLAVDSTNHCGAKQFEQFKLLGAIAFFAFEARFLDSVDA